MNDPTTAHARTPNEEGVRMSEYRKCPHGFHHPAWPHSCDGCWCEGERDRREYGWPHDTTPAVSTVKEADHD